MHSKDCCVYRRISFLGFVEICVFKKNYLEELYETQHVLENVKKLAISEAPYVNL
jgi:hypothetical protein